MNYLIPTQWEQAKETVYVIPAHRFLEARETSEGFSVTAYQKFLYLCNRTGIFLDRARVEQDPYWLQVIPYVVVTCGREPDQKWFRYQRKSGGSESRLKGLFSVGVGGHIERRDDEGFGASAIIRIAAVRELREELTIEEAPILSYVGMLYTPINAVSSVHVGVVCICEVSSDVGINRKESHIAEGEFRLMSELSELSNLKGGEYEEWSRVVVQNKEAVSLALARKP